MSLLKNLQRSNAPGNATWLPTVIGVITAIMAIRIGLQLMLAPPARSEYFLLGYLVSGDIAWVAASAEVIFLGWLSYACFSRRAVAVWGTIVYAGYLIVSIWVWSALYQPQSMMTKVITNALATSLLLVVCRTVLSNRAAFDRE